MLREDWYKNVHEKSLTASLRNEANFIDLKISKETVKRIKLKIIEKWMNIHGNARPRGSAQYNKTAPFFAQFICFTVGVFICSDRQVHCNCNYESNVELHITFYFDFCKNILTRIQWFGSGFIKSGSRSGSRLFADQNSKNC